MQAERDHLRTHVFPALEERLRTRRCHLEWVDLRLGVATASLEDGHQREMHVLKVCLAEVRRCRPFLIVLLGDRYGWVPPAERMVAAAGEEGFSRDVTGRSVTDLEIRFGILDDPEQQPRSLFYFREPLPYADMPAGLAALYSDAHAADPAAGERCARLAVLKQDVALRLPDRVRRYQVHWDHEVRAPTGLDDWGQSVVEDILAELDLDAAQVDAAEAMSWQQAELAVLDDYVEGRARDFVGRSLLLERLAAHASGRVQPSDCWGLCLTGPSGSGKSAVFGELYRRLKRDGSFVFAHAAGASAGAPSIETMLRRWIAELGNALDLDPGLDDDAGPDAVEATFQYLLKQMASQARVIVLVDALDQFEATTRGRFMTWLPRAWPANACLIATAVAGDASTALGRRSGVETVALPPLEAAEAREIVGRICARYHRTLEPAVVDALLAKIADDGPAWSNTLWLVLAVEELNLVDADDFTRAARAYHGTPAEQLRALMIDIVAALSPDVVGLYRQTFERAERLFAADPVRAFLGFMAVGRAGWRESDFRALLPGASGEPWSELKFASMRRLFRGQIRQRGALSQWDFDHAQMRAAVRRHMEANGLDEARLHANVADHLLSLPADDPLRQSETMVHLLGSGDWSRAAGFYGDASLSQAERDGATQVLADVILTRQGIGLEEVLRLLNAPVVPQTKGILAERFTFDLERSLADRAELTHRARLVDEIRKAFDELSKADPDNAGWQRNLSASHIKRGHLLRAQGQVEQAQFNYVMSCMLSHSLANSYLGNAELQRDLSIAYEALAGGLQAKGNLSDALAAYQDSRAIRESLVQSDLENVLWQRDLSVSYNKIGDVLVEQGEYADAFPAYRAALAIAENLAELDPDNVVRQRDLSVSCEKNADVLVRLGRLPGALAGYRSSLAIAERLAESDPINTEWQRDLTVSHKKIGDVFAKAGALVDALTAYQASLATAEKLINIDPEHVGWRRDLSIARERIGDVRLEQGDMPGALAAYQSSRAITQQLAESDTKNAEWQRDLFVSHNKVGDVLAEQDDLAGALAAYEAALAIIESLNRLGVINEGWERDLSVSHDKINRVRRAQDGVTTGQDGSEGPSRARSDLPELLAAYHCLTESDPENPEQQQDLATAQENVGDVFVEMDDFAGADAAYRDSLAVRDRLLQIDPANTRWRYDVALSLQRLGFVATRRERHGDARDAYARGRDILRELVASAPDHATFRQGLAWFETALAEASGRQDQPGAAPEQGGRFIARLRRALSSNGKASEDARGSAGLHPETEAALLHLMRWCAKYNHHDGQMDDWRAILEGWLLIERGFRDIALDYANLLRLAQAWHGHWSTAYGQEVRFHDRRTQPAEGDWTFPHVIRMVARPANSDFVPTVEEFAALLARYREKNGTDVETR
jgi:tetratricopeptide (TPR) repeat protein